MSDNDYDMSSEDEDPNLYYQINYFDNNEEFAATNEEQNMADYYLKMDEVMEHDIEELVDQLIENSYKTGLSKGEAFVKVCSKFPTLQTPSIEDANRWFSGWEEENLNQEYLNLIQAISDYYLSKSNSVTFETILGSSSKFFHKSSRYEIEISDPIEVNVVDHFHGQKMSFQIVAKNPCNYKINHVFQSYLLDPHHILIYDTMDIFLIKLDYEKGEGQILCQQPYHVPGDLQILPDIQNSSNLVLFGLEPYPVDNQGFDCSIQFGQILEDKLSINVNEKILITGRKFFCPKFNKNTLTVFEPVFENDEELFCSVLVKKDFVKKFSFKGVQNVQLKRFDALTKFAWFEDECLVLTENNRYKDCLYSFDISTQTCKMIYMNFPIVSSLHFDFDGNLVAKRNYEISIYFIRKPQKLEQIAWHKICHQSENCESKKPYEKVVKKLPRSSKPFSDLL